jgi:hypothetical protein
MSQVTIFHSIKDTTAPFHRDIDMILYRIKEGKSREVINAIRKEKNKDAKGLLKQRLPAICFSGKFTKRNDNSLIEHSGLICLDFDGYDSQKLLLEAKAEFCSNKYVFACFISPGGDGLKVVVRIPQDPANHHHYFKALQEHFNSEYFDSTSKNLSRVCYESYDPLIYVNNDAETWDSMTQEIRQYSTDDILMPRIKLTKTDEIIRRIKLWWERSYGIVEGERNNNVYVLAAAMNRFGIELSRALEECLEFQHQGFDHKEISKTVNSAYSKKEERNTQFFEDVEKYDEVRSKIQSNTPKKEIVLDLRESGVEDDVIDAVLAEIYKDLETPKFWTVSEKGVISLLHLEFKEFLEDHGFYKYSPEGTKSYIFVKVTNNLIDDTSEEEIKDFVLKYVREALEINVYNFFAEKTKYFKEEFLNLLDPVDVYFVSDTKESSYLYYRNCAVRVTKDTVETIDYMDLGGYVWKRQVIQRDFKPLKDVDCDYKQFVFNVSGGDDMRTQGMESTIGYMLHGYKNLGYCPAVIINDEIITENPEGGTGKGIFVSAIGKMKNLVVLDGKSFSFEKSFPYQLVSTDTQVLTFDDVRKYFDFERLFSIVTEGITLEKKNKDAIKIGFDKSPKIIITTNYAIKGKGNSFERRKWEIEFSGYYSKDYTPEQEFGKLLFSDWSEDEWLRFDNYMISNLQLYLTNGFIKSEYKNLHIRKFIAETDMNFYEWIMDPSNAPLLKENARVYGNDLWNSFLSEFPDFARGGKRSISQSRFYQWVTTYSIFKTKVDPEWSRDAQGKYVIIKTK